MNTVKLNTSQNIQLEYRQAGVGDRILAFLVDSLILFSFGVIVLILYFSFIQFINTEALSLFSFLGLIMLFLLFFYHLACEIFLDGQSIGKRIMKIKVVRLDGSHPTLGNFILRWILRLIDISLSYGVVAIIAISVTENGQRLGDLAAGTTVISLKNPIEFKETIFEDFEPGYEVSFQEVLRLEDKDIHLIKEILKESQKVDNPNIILELAAKLKEIMNVKSQLAPLVFVKTVLKDYNYLNAQYDEL